jgi:hypothetical protein
MKQFKQLREDALMEKLKASAPTAEWIHDFVHSENPKFAGKSKKERINMALGAAYAAKRNEEVEPIDELNKDTVYSYATKAEKDVNKKHKELTSQIKTNNPKSANNTSSKIVKRYAGMDRAEIRLNKEETEQIDELSKDTLDSFIKKSKETYKDVPDTKKGNRLRNTLKAAGKSDAKNEEVSSSKYNADVKRAFPASGVKTIEPKHKYSTMPKDKEKAKGMPANGMHEAMNPAQQAAIAIAIKKKKKKMMEADEALNEKFWDNEGEMVISQCKTIAAKAQMIMSMLDDESKLEAWVQGKMTTAEIAINSVYDHLMYSDDAIDEATGDKSFDSTMKNIVSGTSKQRTADRIAQKKQNQERARNAFGGMFGGGNPADKLKIKEESMAEDKEVWDTPNPKKTHHKLTSAQVSKARARARAAGRPYPNLVDNMAVMKEDAVEEAYKGAGSSALKLADRIRQERLKREASEKRAQEMLGKKSEEKKEVK